MRYWQSKRSIIPPCPGMVSAKSWVEQKWICSWVGTSSSLLLIISMGTHLCVEIWKYQNMVDVSDMKVKLLPQLQIILEGKQSLSLTKKLMLQCNDLNSGVCKLISKIKQELQGNIFHSIQYSTALHESWNQTLQGSGINASRCPGSHLSCGNKALILCVDVLGLKEWKAPQKSNQLPEEINLWSWCSFIQCWILAAS